MSSILLNPTLRSFTPNTTPVPNIAGFYQISRNSSNLALRAATNINIGITGEIYFDSGLGVFRGYGNGGWLSLNSSIGATGPTGASFENQVNFINVGVDGATGSLVNTANIFISSNINPVINQSNVLIRTLQSGNIGLPDGSSKLAMEIYQSSNTITLLPQALPYIPTTSGSNLKSTLAISPFKALGDIIEYPVWSSVERGQIVHLMNDTANSMIRIEPLTYTNTGNIDVLQNNLSALGVALEDGGFNTNVRVCVRGITTVKCTSNINSNYVGTIDVAAVGVAGFVGSDGFIFKPNQIPIMDYINAGYFLESGSSLASNGNLALFYVNPKQSI